jgi:hypothetical protein
MIEAIYVIALYASFVYFSYLAVKYLLEIVHNLACKISLWFDKK